MTYRGQIIGQAFVMLALSGASLWAEVRPAAVFTDHMVLQRDCRIPIWGTSKPGEGVTVEFAGQRKETEAGLDGQWRVDLDPMPANATGQSLTVSSGNQRSKIAATSEARPGFQHRTFTDILVGEVWLGSGQSNIDTPVQVYLEHDASLKEAAGGTYPELRLYRVKDEKGWRQANPTTIQGFSAQLFFFGMRLRQELGVPVGLIEAAVEGSPSGRWISQKAFQADPDIQKAAALMDARQPMEARMKTYDEAMSEWRKKTDAARAAGAPEEKLPRPPQKPVPCGEQFTGEFYEKYIRSLIPYAIRGVLWDQGEGGSLRGIGQPLLMAALIRSWRTDWGQGDFPWLYVQKPSGGGSALNPDDPVNRGAEAFQPPPKSPPPQDYPSSLHQDAFRIMQNPNTFLVMTTDLATGLHPPNKSGYAMRDALVALGAVYGRPVEYYGPMFQSLKEEDGKLRISFIHVGRSLTVPAGQKLQGFLVAGEDKKFHWADAEIDGRTVVLSSPEVPKPVAVRYAWTWPQPWTNLFNSDGLPAIGFRTDSW